MGTKTKKILAALTVTVVASLGAANPAGAKPADNDKGDVVQQTRESWCC
jgi:hypothetical protein